MCCMCVGWFGCFYDVVAKEKKQRSGILIYWGGKQDLERVEEKKLEGKERD